MTIHTTIGDDPTVIFLIGFANKANLLLSQLLNGASRCAGTAKRAAV